jgi:hypothetical protein
VAAQAEVVAAQVPTQSAVVVAELADMRAMAEPVVMVQDSQILQTVQVVVVVAVVVVEVQIQQDQVVV